MSNSMSVTKSYTNRLKSDVKCMLENFEGKLNNILIKYYLLTRTEYDTFFHIYHNI